MLAECPVTLGAGGESREGHVTDLLGPRFTLLHFCDGDVPAALLDLERKLAGDGVPLKPVALTPHSSRRTATPPAPATTPAACSRCTTRCREPRTSCGPTATCSAAGSTPTPADVAAAIEHALRP